MKKVAVVRETIKRTILTHHLIERRSHIVLGLSGGPDSVCLFHVLKSLGEELDFSLHAVHVNHKFRPGAAEQDQNYVENLCADSNISCRTFIYDCNAMARELNLSSEEAGRKARYEAFGIRAGELMEEGVPAEKIRIAVAQNSDDQAETILLRLLRGTGPDGLGGMSYDRLEGSLHIIRPLLDVWREDIEAYCRAQGLKPRVDHTNLQPIYTRNKIRLELLPLLKEHFNPAVSQSLIRLGAIARQDKDYLWKQAEEQYDRLIQSCGALDLKGLKELELPIRHRVIMKAFQQAGLTRDIGSVHLECADQVLEGGKSPAFVDFPGNYIMAIDGELLRFSSKKEQVIPKLSERLWPEDIRLKLNLSLIDAEQGENHKKQTEQSRSADGDVFGQIRPSILYRADFDWEKVQAACGPKPDIRLRSRQPGDYIRLRKGRKKIQDFFVDCKIPKEQRAHIPLVAAGSEILWIISLEGGTLERHRFSQQYTLDQTTKKTLSLEIICEM